jgi:hypothetical protein
MGGDFWFKTLFSARCVEGTCGSGERLLVQTGLLVQGPCDHDLERVNRLLVSSLQSERDTMRSFLDAWTAMEILINKTFKSYEGRYKYPLVDKFRLLASRLCPENADEDVRQLTRVKKIRDNLLHGQDIDEASLPVRTVQDLARRYLRLRLAG